MPGNHTDDTPVISQFGLGQVPFWLKQSSLVTAPGRSLRPGGLMLTRRAADFCDFSGDSRILDTGCGYGMTLAYLDGTLGISGTGCDPAPEVMAGAVKRQHRPGGLVRAGLPALPFRSGYFNGIFCECVLSLMDNRAAGLEELYRVTAPNGRLVITDLYIRKWRPRPTKPPARAAYSRSCLDGAVSMMEMLTAVEQAGFKTEIVEDHSGLLRQLGGLPGFFRPQMQKTGYCMIIAAKY
ncbi:MAG: DVU_1556 family methyltransferase [Desulfobacter sp.]